MLDKQIKLQQSNIKNITTNTISEAKINSQLLIKRQSPQLFALYFREDREQKKISEQKFKKIFCSNFYNHLKFHLERRKRDICKKKLIFVTSHLEYSMTRTRNYMRLCGKFY